MHKQEDMWVDEQHQLSPITKKKDAFPVNN